MLLDADIAENYKLLRCGKKGTIDDAIIDLNKAIAYLSREVLILSQRSKDADNANSRSKE